MKDSVFRCENRPISAYFCGLTAGLFLEQTVESVAGVARAARRRRIRSGSRRAAAAGHLCRCRLPRHGDAGRKQIAQIRLVLQRNANGDRLIALEARGGLEVRALLAAMERRSAFGALAIERSRVREQRRRAVVTARGCHCLNEARQARSGDIERWARARGLRPPSVSIGRAVAVTVG